MESKGLLRNITGALLSTLLLVSASFVSLGAAKPAPKTHEEGHGTMKAGEKKEVKEHKAKTGKKVTKGKKAPRRHYKAHKAGAKKGATVKPGAKKGEKAKPGTKHHKTMKHTRKTAKTHPTKAVKHEATPAHKS